VEVIKFPVGLHGVGASVVNALSEIMEVEIKRNGKIYKQTYSRGKTQTPLIEIGESRKTGSKTMFKPDPQIFEELEYNYGTLEHRLREMAFLNKGIKITLKDEREGQKQTEVFHYEGGIKEFVKHQNKNKEVIHEEIIYFELQKDDEHEIEVAMQYTDRYNELILSYANNINTSEGGTHMIGFKSALTRVFNDYAKKNKFIKDNEDGLSGEDVREGLTAVISVKLTNPQFEGQTKTKLGNSEMRGFVETSTSENLTAFLEENPSQARIILDKCLRASRAREAARKAKRTNEKKRSTGRIDSAR